MKDGPATGLPDCIPYFPRGVRVKHDTIRGCYVLLGPERALMLDAVSTAILDEVDGTASVAQICQHLAEAYRAPIKVITDDTTTFLNGLALRQLLDYRNG